MVQYHNFFNESKDFTTYIEKHSGDETLVYKSVQGTDLYLSLYYPENLPGDTLQQH